MKIELCCRRKSSGKTTNNLWELCKTSLHDENAKEVNIIHFQVYSGNNENLNRHRTETERKPNMSLY